MASNLAPLDDTDAGYVSEVVRTRTWPSGNLMVFAHSQKALVTSNPTQGQQYRFRLNPDKLSVTKGKIQKWILTKAGFERQFWGNDLYSYSYSGTSGAFRPDEILSSYGPGAPTANGVASNPKFDASQNLDPSQYNITNTYAWKKFTEFERFYTRSDERPVFMSFWGESTALIGAFDHFEKHLQAEPHPRIIHYSFKFTALPFPDNESYNLNINRYT